RYIATAAGVHGIPSFFVRIDKTILPNLGLLVKPIFKGSHRQIVVWREADSCPTVEGGAEQQKRPVQ
ncbi:MAG: hypothetical protein ACI3XG_00525, partial [Faecousia sp.]